MSYRRHYDSPLLDELHNYFPQVLYSPERFRTLPELLTYVQDRVHQRFDLFTLGRREFLEREQRTHVISTPPTRTSRELAPSISMLFESNRTIPINNDLRANNEFLTAINLMSGLFAAPQYPVQQTMGAQPPPGFMDPVIVRPTAEQIESATAIDIIDSDEEMCAICQDLMPAGTQALGINACSHRFHSGCIRTWFAGNVVCPVCRHDIRDPPEEES